MVMNIAHIVKDPQTGKFSWHHSGEEAIIKELIGEPVTLSLSECHPDYLKNPHAIAAMKAPFQRRLPENTAMHFYEIDRDLQSSHPSITVQYVAAVQYTRR